MRSFTYILSGFFLVVGFASHRLAVPEVEADVVPIVASCGEIVDSVYYPSAFNVSFFFKGSSSGSPPALSSVLIDKIDGPVGRDFTISAEGYGLDPARGRGYAVLRHPSMRHDLGCGNFAHPTGALRGSSLVNPDLGLTYGPRPGGRFHSFENTETNLEGLNGRNLDEGNMGMTWGNGGGDGLFYIEVMRKVGASGGSFQQTLSYHSVIND